MKVLAVLASVLVLGLNAQASLQDFEGKTPQELGFSSEAEMKNYFTIEKVTVTAQPAPDAQWTQPVPAPVSNAIALGNGLFDSLGPVLATPENPMAWIAFGKKVWEVVVENKPVVNVQTMRISVLPNDKTQWAQMAGWRGPRAFVYTVQAINGFGTVAIDQNYTVSYNYGGNLNGKGRYLANATIIPTTISVGWGYTLNSNVEVGTILNAGTVDSPIPAVDLDLKWDMKTILKETQGVDSFYVKGDGSFQHISK